MSVAGPPVGLPRPPEDPRQQPEDLPPRSRWTSFVGDPSEPRPRTLREEGNPAHRARVEHNRDTILST